MLQKLIEIAAWVSGISCFTKGTKISITMNLHMLGLLPLTGPIILNWACALKASQATVHVPSDIDSFNPTNKALIIHAKKLQLQPLPSPMSSVDTNFLVSVLLIQSIMKLELFFSTTNLDITTLASPFTSTTQTLS